VREPKQTTSRLVRISAWVLVSPLIVGLARPSEALGQHPLSVDDTLRMEAIGRAAIVNQGHTLIYERIPPYESAPNLSSMTVSGGDSSASAHLYRIDLVHPGEADEPLFEQSRRGGYWLGSISPTSERIAIFSLRDGNLRAGVYSIATRTVRWFAFTPNYSLLIERPVWISADELVYAALAPGESPPILNRQALAESISSLWKKSFDGQEVSATAQESAVTGIQHVGAFRSGELLRVNVATGALQKVADGYFYDLRVSPDGTHLAALREGGIIQPDAEMPAPVSLDSRFKSLVVFDLQSDHRVDVSCSSCDVALGTLNWSADGRFLTYFSRAMGEPETASALFKYDARRRDSYEQGVGTLQPTCVFEWRPQAAAIGNVVAIFGRPPNTPRAPTGFWQCGQAQRADWFVTKRDGAFINVTKNFATVAPTLVGLNRNGLYVLADGGLWRVAASGRRALKAVFRGEGLHLWEEAKYLGSISQEAMNVGNPVPVDKIVLESTERIVSVDLKSNQVLPLLRPTPTAELLAVDSRTETAVFSDSGPSGTRLLLSQGKSLLDRPILQINSHLANVTEVRETEIAYEAGPYGRHTSCVVLPANWTSEKRFPLIVHVYPGTPGSCSSLLGLATLGPHNLKLLASRGYAVLFASTPWRETHAPDGSSPGFRPLVMAAVDESIRAGIADPDRMGVYGFSQGFHDVLELITQTGRFHAAVALNGISDIASDYGTTALPYLLAAEDPGNLAAGDPQRFELWLGAKPWENPARYIQGSPIFRAGDIHTPLLIMHSDMDVFPIGQSQEIFSALYRLRREAQYVTYWGEGHGNVSPANIRDMWQRIFAWYDSHLANESHATRP
jgi:hypothetical protein